MQNLPLTSEPKSLIFETTHNSMRRVSSEKIYVFDIPEIIELIGSYLLKGLNQLSDPVPSIQSKEFFVFSCLSKKTKKIAEQISSKWQSAHISLQKQKALIFETSQRAIETINKEKYSVVNFANILDLSRESMRDVIRECPTVKHILIESELPFCSSIYSLLYLPWERIETLNLFNLKNLRSLQKSFSVLTCLTLENLSSCIELPNDMPMLRSLFLNDCCSVDKWPNNIPMLKSLTLKNCYINKLPTGMTSLTSLTLNNTHILTEIDPYPNDLWALRSLELKDCQFPSSITLMTSLTSLTLKWNQEFDSDCDCDIKNLKFYKEMDSLKSIDVHFVMTFFVKDLDSPLSEFVDKSLTLKSGDDLRRFDNNPLEFPLLVEHWIWNSTSKIELGRHSKQSY